MITTINLLIVGVGFFSYFAFTAPEDCPRKYMVLQKSGGVLTNLGQIYEYCTLDYGHRWKLKKGVKVTFDEVLKDAK
jgi:hypothetical protein|tara:strand:+ start:260 stop:490 length:231 start_codon:yes stop_codon:yes gene_type:complete